MEISDSSDNAKRALDPLGFMNAMMYLKMSDLHVQVLKLLLIAPYSRKPGAF